MLSRITNNIKQAWSKTLQEFHDFEAQQQTERSKDKERARQARTKRAARLSRTSKLAVTAADGLTVRRPSLGNDDVQAGSAFKRRRLDPVAAKDDAESVGLGIQSGDSPGRLKSTQPSRQGRERASSDKEISRLRSMVVQLQGEVAESKAIIRRLHEQLEEQDDYIRAMEFEKSRVEITKQGSEVAASGIYESDQDGQSSLENVADYLPSVFEQTDDNYEANGKEGQSVVDRRGKAKKSWTAIESQIGIVSPGEDRSFERMSPLSLREIDMIVNTTR